MTALAEAMERHHKVVITGLALLIVFFLVACTFHDIIPVCHYLFGCDHGLH